MGGSSSVVAAVVSLASTGISLWLRWHDRTRASWNGAVAMLKPELRAVIRSRRPNQPAETVIMLFNVGDGAAQDVSVEIDGEHALIIDNKLPDVGLFEFSALVLPGNSLNVLVPVPSPLYPEDSDWWIRVEWTDSPTRLGRRWVQTLHLQQKRFERHQPVAAPKS